MKYEKWEDVPKWIQELVISAEDVWVHPEGGYLCVESKGQVYSLPQDHYTSAVHLYEQRSIDDATPQEWDEAARKQYDSPDTPIPKTPSYISDDEVLSGKRFILDEGHVGYGAPKEVKKEENWFVQLPNSRELIKAEVILLTNCVVGLRYNGFRTESYWVRKEVEFVEKIK